MKNPLSFRFCVAATAIANLAFLVACGDTVENVYQSGSEVVSSVGDLPECSSKNDGEIAWVKGEPSVRICSDGEWYATKSDESDFSCKTEELKDKSGLKIVCNGDSIGVVLNGENGKDGKAGKDGDDGKDGKAGSGCTMKDKTDSTITVVCGDSTMVVELGPGSNELELDSERVAVSLDSLAGYSQKGPFLKGSTVYLYELSDGRTLKQTNGNFTSYITRDDGRYKFTARDLASQYAMIVVEGNYRNEVTGNPSDAPIRLRALTDMRKHSDANINLLTHLEFDRVYYLVTREKKTVKQAKKQAQNEIFKVFDIDTTGFTGSAEDLDVFGATDADAALLAISILLQGDGDETELSVLLTEIANDMETDGTWDDSTAKTRLADWVALADGKGRLANFRSNVGGWQLSDTVPEFEKFVRNFYSGENNLGKCGSKDVPVGTVKEVGNARSKYYAATYSDTSKSKMRFICVDAESARWRVATDIEKDTSGLGHEFKTGDVTSGKVNSGLKYVYQDGDWRHGTTQDNTVGEGCMQSRRDNVVKGKDGDWYKCIADSAMKYLNADGVEEASWSGAWRIASDIEKDTNGLGHDGYSEGDTAWGKVNHDKSYGYEDGNWVSTGIIDGTPCIRSLAGKVLQDTDGVWKVCSVTDNPSAFYGTTVHRVWIPVSDNLAKDTLWTDVPAGGWKKGDVRNGYVNDSLTYVYKDRWSVGTALDSILVGLGGSACIDEGDTSSVKYNGVYYVCMSQATFGINGVSKDTLIRWGVAPDMYNKTFDLRDSCAAGKMYDGSVITGNSGNYYVCDAGTFKEVKYADLKSMKACVSYNQNHIYKVLGSFYKCVDNGWTSVSDGAKGELRIESQTYKTVVIGKQHWMAENLNLKTDSSYCYGDSPSNCTKYGRLYTWNAANKACPAGWRLPSRDEWKDLIDLADGGVVHSGTRLKATSGWKDGGNGNDEYSFSAKPAGYRLYSPGSYAYEGEIAYFWSGTVSYTDIYYIMKITYDNEYAEIDYNGSKNAYSVRCIQN